MIARTANCSLEMFLGSDEMLVMEQSGSENGKRSGQGNKQKIASRGHLQRLLNKRDEPGSGRTPPHLVQPHLLYILIFACTEVSLARSKYFEILIGD